MLAQFVCVLVALLVTGVYLKWLHVKSFWKRRNVPFDPPHPIFGSLTFLHKQNPGMWMADLYQRFKKAPYVGIWLFWKPALVINDPEIASRVLVKDFDNFRDRHLGSGKSDPIGGLNIFALNDPLWSNIRRKLTVVFSSAKMKVYTSLMTTKAKELCVRIQREMEKGEKFNIRDVLTDYTTDIVGAASFGVQSDTTLTGDSVMRSITRDFQTYTFKRSIAHTFNFFLPGMIDIFRLSFFPKEATDYLRKIWNTVVQQRGGYDKQEEKKDLVDALIKLRHDNMEEMTEDIILAQAAIMVQGGFETSAASLTFGLYELAHLPVAQEKLYQELKEIQQKLNGKEFNMDVLSDADYLNAVIKETLRKRPPMGYIDRISRRAYKIDEHLTIPAGMPVCVNAMGMQMDPEYYPEPSRFNPDRFLTENEKQNRPFTYMPFGDGPRNCIGRRFAMQTIRFALAELVLQFEVRPLPGAPTPNEIECDKNAMFLLPGQAMHLDFVPRK